jgi:hypothetical protein
MPIRQSRWRPALEYSLQADGTPSFGAGLLTSADPAGGPTAGLPNVAAAYKRTERLSALAETFGHSVCLGRETGHNAQAKARTPA